MNKVRSWGKSCYDFATRWLHAPITKIPYLAVPEEEWLKIKNEIIRLEATRIETIREYEAHAKKLIATVDSLKELLRDRDLYRERAIAIPKTGKAKRFAWFFKPKAVRTTVQIQIDRLDKIVDVFDGFCEFGRYHVKPLGERLPYLVQK